MIVVSLAGYPDEILQSFYLKNFEFLHPGITAQNFSIMLKQNDLQHLFTFNSTGEKSFELKNTNPQLLKFSMQTSSSF